MPNTLIVGFDTARILDHIPEGPFLLVDDGPIIGQLELPERRAVTFLDLSSHAFSPLKDMSYRKARAFLDVLNAAFPEGENTLTRRYANFQILSALLAAPKRLDRLIQRSKETEDAWQKVQTLLLSPVLERVLNRPTNLSFKGTLVARLDRAELGDFDCFVLANFLIQEFAGTVVIPDYGFYQCASHASLLREGRLVAGLTSLSEAPSIASRLHLFPVKAPARTTEEDAVALAPYLTRFLRGTDGYTSFVRACMDGSYRTD